MSLNKTIIKNIDDKLNHAKTIVNLSPNKSMEICQEAYSLAKSNNLSLEQGYALIGMALVSRAKSEKSNMLELSFKALSIFEDKNQMDGQIKALNLIGIAYFYSSIYEEALKYFLRVEELLQLNKDDMLLSSVLNNLGEVYRESGAFDKAMEYYKKAIDIVVKNDLPINQAVILSNMGQIHFDKGEFKNALDVYNNGYELIKDCNDMVNLGEIENRIGMVYFELGNYKKAEEYYYSSISRLEGIDNKYYAIDTLINIARIYEVKDSCKALDVYKKSIQLAEDVGAEKKLCKIYKLLSEYFESQGDYINALTYYKNYSNFNEQIMSVNLSNKLEILNIELINSKIKGEFEQVKIRLKMEIDIQKDELEKIKEANIGLQKKAYEDELTGVLNRRSINIYLRKILEEMILKDDHIVLYMIDIDNFKKYNDYWGHSKGDECIRKISGIIQKVQNGTNDTFGRYGGEEFIYISTSLNYNDALKLGNKIRNEVNKIGLYYMDKGERRDVTISVGGTIGSSQCFKTMANILELADKQLYKAKAMGKDITLLEYASGKTKLLSKV